MDYEKLAAEIVKKHCSDLPLERQNLIREAIEEALIDWGCYVGGMESQSYRE